MEPEGRAARQFDELPGQLPGVTATLRGQAEAGAAHAAEDAHSAASKGQTTPVIRATGSAAKQPATGPGKDAD